MRKIVVFAVAVLVIILVIVAARSSHLTKSATAADFSDRILFLHLTSKIYRLSGDTLSPLPISSADFGDMMRPLISSDQHWIAYLQSNDIWIFDATTGQSRQASHAAQPPTEKFLPVNVFLLGWSADSRQLLFRVAPGEEDCEDCEPRMQAQADYGFFSYDPTENAIAPVRLPENFEFRAWLPDGRFLGVIGRETVCRGSSIENCGTLALITAGSDQPHIIEGYNGHHRDLAISNDGQLVLTSNPYTGDDREDHSQIVEINLGSGDARMITDIANYGQWRNPKFSPDGQRVAYTFYDQKNPGHAYLYINNDDKLRCSGTLDFHWLSDQHLAVECERKLIVVDLNGKVLARVPVPRQ